MQRDMGISLPPEDFYVLEDVCFKKTCVSCVIAGQHSSRLGIGRKTRVTVGITPQHNATILA